MTMELRLLMVAIAAVGPEVDDGGDVMPFWAMLATRAFLVVLLARRFEVPVPAVDVSLSWRLADVPLAVVPP